MKIGKLFLGLSRTNAERVQYVIACWQHADNYWRWAVRWTPPNNWREAFCLPRIGPMRNMGTEWFGSWGLTSISCWLTLPLIGGVSLSTQPPPLGARLRTDVT